MIDITSEVDPAGAVVELQNGILKFELPKVATAARESSWSREGLSLQLGLQNASEGESPCEFHRS